MSEKSKRKELKQPDAFQKAGGEASAWLVERQKLVAVAIGVALVGGAGVAMASYLSNRGDSKAAKELGGALAVLGRGVNASGVASEPTDEPPFKSEKEKDEAIIKELSEFRKDHPSHRASSTAALPLAQALLRQGKSDEALSGFDDYLKNARVEDPLRATALEGKGYAFEAKGELDSALSAFDQLARENKTEFLSGMGLYHRARMLILQGKKDEAAKQLSEIPAAAPNSAAARLATDRMAVLAAEGVKVPLPVAPAVDAGK